MAVRAPDFRPELEWVNTGGQRLTLADFRGRLLLLDFWTYGCINCLHLLPELAEVARHFPDEVALAGVHAGKFPNERVTANLARACERLGVHHPVLNDRHFRTWREYAIRAWPTLVMVSPDGYVLGMQSGEVPAERLIPVVERYLSALRQARKLPGGPLPSTRRESALPASGLLRFPGGVAAAPGRLYVADSGHHRVMELQLEGGGDAARVLRSFGGGAAGWLDGPGEAAAFRDPHGLEVVGETLYVADTGNHLLRAVDLATGMVSTVAGVGDQARTLVAAGPALETPLNSPWDVLFKDGRLYLAMAGSHQLWRLDPLSESLEPFAGSGAEEVHDAELERAALAQPSGLASDGRRVFFADAESSAIRYAVAGADVSTLVGTGLFDSGDRDGSGDEARLQHPQAIAWWPGERRVLVADTYNHRIRTVDPYTREARVLAGSGEPGFEDGPAGSARFWEPGGIALDAGGGAAWVADTNNHALRRVDVASGEVRTLRLAGAA